jgi:hypothetical protein
MNLFPIPRAQLEAEAVEELRKASRLIAQADRPDGLDRLAVVLVSGARDRLDTALRLLREAAGSGEDGTE